MKNAILAALLMLAIALLGMYYYATITYHNTFLFQEVCQSQGLCDGTNGDFRGRPNVN